MRMRRKKNLEARLQECESYLLDCDTADLNFENEEGNKCLYSIEDIFGNENPLVLEIGCGKGAFACEYAKRNPDKNIIAVEKVGNVIVAAVENAMRDNIPNLRFMKCAAEYLPRFIPANSVSEIYLNFSCPFPKAKYAKHRLTHPRFLEIYKQLMTADCVICQKTDNPRFFEFSIENLSQSGFALSNVSLDLHNSSFEGNIVTEYETRFASQGLPIYRLEARLRQ